MRFTYNQLKKYLNTNLNANEIANALTMLGLEIEDVEDIRSPLSDFIVGEVIECKDHPDSDHLHLLKVNTGTEILDVVCGAPNVKKGLKGILARNGNIIPVNGMKLKKTMVRGYESNGMMCSAYELNIGEDHDGIIELPNEITAGTDAISALEKVYNLDVIYEGNVLPNRPDYLGVIGIARDLSAGGFGEFIPPQIQEIKSDYDSPIIVENKATEDAKEFNTRYIKGVENKDSPRWLVEYLKSSNMNSISALVDITNFCLHNINRPLHVFDADKIKGKLVIDYAKGGENFTALDGNTYILNEGDIVIKDDNGIQSLAGVMGGLNSSCSMETKNVLLESAYLNPVKIRKTAKRLKIESDSKFRFERGIDQCCTIWGMEYATNLILDICGGSPSRICKTGKCQYQPHTIEFPVSYFEKRIGFDIPKQEMVKILTNLGCEVSEDKDKLFITPPSYREDIEGKDDITEELVRVYGFDKLPSVSVRPDSFNLVVDTKIIHKTILPRILAYKGLTEVYTWSFMSSKKELDTTTPSIKITNPIASDLDVMRKSIIPNLLDGIKSNLSRCITTSNLFEIGPTFYGAKPMEQNISVAGVRQGEIQLKNWQGAPRTADVYDVKDDVISILKVFGVSLNSIKLETTNLPNWLNPYKSASIIFANKTIGYFGEIHPLTLKKFGIKNTNVVAFEVNLDFMPNLKLKGTSKKRLIISDLLPVYRDFSVIIDENVLGGTILSEVKNANKEYISDAIIFDIYKGDNLPKGTKSVAIRITIEQKDKTLTDDEINVIFKSAIDKVVKLGGKLRDK